ncbi:MAG: pyrroline-5-carboxylate reductase [Pseudomonadota bacterium]|nr:pyrroline-5-carboxylate reductase [Pseudomonadota bacterium]
MTNKKVGFIGVGSMGGAILKALLRAKVILPENAWATNRSPGKLTKISDEFPIHVARTNEELVENVDVVFVCVKPQDLLDVLEPLSTLIPASSVVISIAAGIGIKEIKKILHNSPQVVRVMPNTPVEIGKAVVGYAVGNDATVAESVVIELLKPLGLLVPVTEGDMLEGLTVSCASGTGFVFELMLYWQEWIEGYGFEPETAKKMAVQTFLGAALQAENSIGQSLENLQARVVSKKGITTAGLESMRELDIERALRVSFEKAILRDRELGKRI